DVCGGEPAGGRRVHAHRSETGAVMTGYDTHAPEAVATRTRISPSLVIALVLAGLFALAAVAPALLTAAEPTAQNFADALRPPSFTHWFGTDESGRDLYTRVIHGTAQSLTIGIGA